MDYQEVIDFVSAAADRRYNNYEAAHKAYGDSKDGQRLFPKPERMSLETRAFAVQCVLDYAKIASKK